MPISTKVQRTHKLTGVSVLDTTPTGEVPHETVIGPPINANASKRLDEILGSKLTPNLQETQDAQIEERIVLEQAVDLQNVDTLHISDFMVTNHTASGQVELTFNLYSIEGLDELNLAIYLGRSEVDDDAYSLVTAVSSEEDLRQDMASATGDVGQAITPGLGKRILMDASFATSFTPPYDEILLVYEKDEVIRLLAFSSYPLTNNNTAELATLEF